MPTDADLIAADLRAIHLGKVTAYTLLAIALWVVKPLWPTIRAGEITLVMVVALLPSLGILSRRGFVPPVLLLVSHGVDLIAIAVAVYLLTSGIGVVGVADDLIGPLLYAVLTVLVGLTVSTRASFLVAGASVAVMGAMMWAEHQGLLPAAGGSIRPPALQVVTLAGVGTCLCIMAWAVSLGLQRIAAARRHAERLRSEAISALSHDLKNPLMVIDGHASILEEDGSEDAAQSAGAIRNAARQALDLIHNVLDAAAMEGRPLTAQSSPVDLDALITEVTDAHRLSAMQKGLDLRCHVSETASWIQGDSQLLSRALGNMLSNAVKYTDPPGRIEVTADARNGRVVLSVQDSGRGVDPGEVERLFEAFRRGESSSGIEGTGLGLYIVQRIAEAHGGDVRVESQPGQGSRFSIEIPQDEGAGRRARGAENGKGPNGRFPATAEPPRSPRPS